MVYVRANGIRTRTVDRAMCMAHEGIMGRVKHWAGSTKVTRHIRFFVSNQMTI